MWLVVVAYLALYGWILWDSGGLPYVMDNNETFSALVHARNLHDHGVSDSYGLPDESATPHASGHPYVYTHGGNFPRIPALALYSLGARSAESQIVVTTLTAGLLALLLAYAWFGSLVGPGFAVVCCLLLMTDYVMFTQWNVVTWRVWHAVFFFGALLGIRGFARGSPGRWAPLVVLVHAGLFYYEIIFALYASGAAALYAAVELRRRPGRLLGAWGTASAGALLSVALFVVQLVAYLGWEGFLTDLKLTFVARNQASDPVALLAQLQAFVEAHGIAYMYNVQQEAGGRSFGSLASWMARYVLRVYTPALPLLVGLWFAGRLAGEAFDRIEGSSDRAAGATRPRLARWGAVLGRALGRPVAQETALPLTIGALLIFAASVIVDGSFAGLRGAHRPLELWGLRLALLGGVALGAGLVLLRALQARFAQEGTPSRGRLMAGVLLMLAASVWVRAHEAVYEGSYYYPLWQQVLGLARETGLLQIGLVGVAATALHAILTRTAGDLSRSTQGALRLLPFLACSLGSFCVVYLFSPGYVQTGYLKRYAPLTIFFHLVPLAWMLYTLGRTVARSLREGARVVPAGCAVLGLGVTLYWADLQLSYARFLPTDHYAFLDHLRAPRYRGASFVTNNFAAPVAVSSGGWAYVDPVIGQGLLRAGDEAPEVARDFRYLWAADRESNRGYQTPEFFVCMMWADLRTAVVNASDAAERWAPGCSDLGLVRAAEAGGLGPLGLSVVARDESGRDRWAIVELDWQAGASGGPGDRHVGARGTPREETR